MESKGLLQFEIIINVLVSFFRFTLIHILWAYSHYTFLILSVRGPTLADPDYDV